MRRWLRMVAGALVVGCAGRAAADDPAVPAGAPAAAEALGWRYFPVDDLILGPIDAHPDRLPWIVPPEDTNDDERPMFGGEAEEAVLPFGAGPELVDLVKSGVGAPDAWTREGTWVAAVDGLALLIRQTPAVLDATARFLAGLRADAHRSVAIDVVALAGDGAGLASADGRSVDLAAAVAAGRLVPLDLARAHGRIFQRVVGRGGRQRAFVQGYAAVIANAAKVADPRVGVLSEGVGFDVRPLAVAPAAIRIDVRAAWGRLAAMGSSSGRDTGPIALPRVRGATSAAVLDVVPGAWALLPSSGTAADGVVFAVRATPVPLPPPAAPPPLVAMPDDAPEGPLEAATLDVTDLFERVEHRRGTEVRLSPSEESPPEPPELPEPRGRVEADTIVTLLRGVVAPAMWDRAGVELSIARGRLRVRHDAPRLAAVRATLDDLRRAARAAARVELVTVRLPLASVPEWWTGFDAPCLADGGAGLWARAGAVVVDRATLRLPDGARDAAIQGTQVAYLADFAIRAAEKRSGAQPVPARVLDGASNDVRCCRAGGGALLELRLDRGRVERFERTPTPHGDLDLPVLRVGKVRGSLVTAFDATHVVAADLDGDALTLTLLVVHATNP